MLLVHEDDQDLILGQAAPLSISTHPTNACCPTRAMPLRPAAASHPTAPFSRLPTAELVLLGRCCFAQCPGIISRRCIVRYLMKDICKFGHCFIERAFKNYVDIQGRGEG